MSYLGNSRASAGGLRRRCCTSTFAGRQITSLRHPRYTQRRRTRRELPSPPASLCSPGSGVHLAQRGQQQRNREKGSNRRAARGAGAGVASGAAKERSESGGGEQARRQLGHIVAIVVASAGHPRGGGQCRHLRRNQHSYDSHRRRRPRYAGPGELLRAPPTRTARAGSWATSPGYTRAGLILSNRDTLVRDCSLIKQESGQARGGRGRGKQRRELSWRQSVHYYNERHKPEEKQEANLERSVPIKSRETSRLDHPSRKASTYVAARWKSRRIWSKLSNGGTIYRDFRWTVFPRYLQRDKWEKSCPVGHVARHQRCGSDISEVIATATTAVVASQLLAAHRKHKQSSISREYAYQKISLGLGGSDAGPPAAALHPRPQYGSSTRTHRQSASSSSAECGNEEKNEATKGAGRGKESLLHTANVHAKGQQRERRRRQYVGNINVPNHLLAPMRLAPLGFTGPLTSTKQKKNKNEEKKQKLESSLLWFDECVPFVRAVCSDTSSSFCDRIIDDSVSARCQNDALDGHRLEGAGTATAFRVSRDSASRTRVCHKDHEDENNDGDVFLVVLCAPTRIHVDQLPSRQASRFVRKRKRTARRKWRSSSISKRKTYEDSRECVPLSRVADVGASVVPFIDVLAYTAYNGDKNDYEDNGVDIDDGQAPRNQEKIHHEPKKVPDEYNADTWFCFTNDLWSDLRDEDEHQIAYENKLHQDYTCVEFDRIDHNISRKWTSSFSTNKKEYYRRESKHVGCNEHEYLIVDKFNGKRGKGNSEQRCSDNTAWFQKPITRRKGRGGEGKKSKRHEDIDGTDKPRVRGSYFKLLLFILYLLAWPLLCSTSPSGHLASTFAQNPTFVNTKNLVQHNTTSSETTSLSSSSTVIVHQHQQPQQYVQDSDYNTDDNERHRHHQQQQEQMQQSQQYQQQQKARNEKRSQLGHKEQLNRQHPYNEYTWELNQMNPWLSACDLSGPAPADLQGSCGLPEVSQFCPMSCAKKRSQRRDDFFDVIERMRFDSGTMNKSKTKSTAKNVADAGKKNDVGTYTDEGVRTAPEQCLFYLEESHKRDICRDDFGLASKKSFVNPRVNRYRFISGLRLRHCCEHTVINSLAPGKDSPLENVLNGGQKCANALDKLLFVDMLAARLHCEFEEVLSRYDCAQPYSVIHNCTHCKVRKNLLSYIY